MLNTYLTSYIYNIDNMLKDGCSEKEVTEYIQDAKGDILESDFSYLINLVNDHFHK